MANIYGGYRVKTTNIAKLEKILRNAKDALHTAAQREYGRLLSAEISEIVDDIALNIAQRPPCPILDEAVRRLNSRIESAEMCSSGTEYDLRAWVSVIPDERYTYLLLNAANKAVSEAFEGAEDIEPYHISAAEAAAGATSEISEKWNALYKRCHGAAPILSAGLTSQVVPEPDALVFELPAARAASRALREKTLDIMNRYACGREINKQQLMPFMEKALSYITDTSEGQEELKEMTSRLTVILPVITREMVTMDPSAPIQQGDIREEATDAGNGAE